MMQEKITKFVVKVKIKIKIIIMIITVGNAMVLKLGELWKGKKCGNQMHMTVKIINGNNFVKFVFEITPRS